jgi:hypothetical protein
VPAEHGRAARFSLGDEPDEVNRVLRSTLVMSTVLWAVPVTVSPPATMAGMQVREAR